MDKSHTAHWPSQSSFEFYREIVDELLSPIDLSLEPQVRYELYLSKLVYLENLREQCFRSVNKKSMERVNSFSGEDLQTIQNAIVATHQFLRDTILEDLHNRIERIKPQRLDI